MLDRTSPRRRAPRDDHEEVAERGAAARFGSPGGAPTPRPARRLLRPEQLPAPARAEDVERAAEELHLSRRHRPPVDLGLHAEAVDDDRLLRAELADAARAVAGADAALPH